MLMRGALNFQDLGCCLFIFTAFGIGGGKFTIAYYTIESHVVFFAEIVELGDDVFAMYVVWVYIDQNTSCGDCYLCKAMDIHVNLVGLEVSFMVLLEVLQGFVQ